MCGGQLATSTHRCAAPCPAPPRPAPHRPAPQVGEHAGVGCMVSSCGSCRDCADNLEQHCAGCVFTYNGTMPDGSVTQGGYSTHIIVNRK